MASLRRKLAIATWSGPNEPNIYGRVSVDATPVLAYVDWLRAKTGEKITLTHVIGKACGMVLAEAPTLNGYIRFGSYIQHKSADVAFLIAFEEGQNLTKAKVEAVDKKSVTDIAVELKALAEKVHKGKDEAFNKSMGPVKLLPVFLLRQLLWFVGVLTSSWGVSLPMFGLEPFPFGACIVTNVGVFGLDEGFIPPTPFARVPLYVLISAVKDQPWVIDGQVVVRKILTLTATLDHRYVDGAQIAVLSRVLKGILENPWQLEGLQGPPALTEKLPTPTTTPA